MKPKTEAIWLKKSKKKIFVSDKLENCTTEGIKTEWLSEKKGRRRKEKKQLYVLLLVFERKKSCLINKDFSIEQ